MAEATQAKADDDKDHGRPEIIKVTREFPDRFGAGPTATISRTKLPWRGARGGDHPLRRNRGPGSGPSGPRRARSCRHTDDRRCRRPRASEVHPARDVIQG